MYFRCARAAPRFASDDARVARLDDHTAGAGRDEAAGGTQACSHAPLGGRRRDVAALPQRPGALLAGLPEHERGVTLRAGSASIANAPELGIELVLSHHTSLDLACWRDEIWRTRWNSRRWQTATGSQRQISDVDGTTVSKTSSKTLKLQGLALE